MINLNVTRMFNTSFICCARSVITSPSKTSRFLQRYNLRSLSTVIPPAPSLPSALLERARSISSEHTQLSKQLAQGFDTTIAKKVGELSIATKTLADWEAASNSFGELQNLLHDPSTDPELRSLAAEEIQSTSESLDRLNLQLQASLIPAHPFAHLPCLLELRPGAGGNEAALFAGDLMRMYQAFCKRHSLRTSILKLDKASTNGTATENQIQEVVLEIEGEGTYGLLRCEAGVHRVQRVPATETKGRTHTSAVSVIILPNFPSDGREELGANTFDNPLSDYYVDPKDVKMETYRSQGAGGQHVNTTDSAVRLIHLPTNTVVTSQNSRSQPKNRQNAWTVLRARIAQGRREKREEEMAQIRLSVAGVSKMGRGDKIRTYNWSQQRVTDHRSGITLHHLDNILEGGDSLDKVMESVRIWQRERDIQVLLTDEQAMTNKKAKNS